MTRDQLIITIVSAYLKLEGAVGPWVKAEDYTGDSRILEAFDVLRETLSDLKFPVVTKDGVQ